MLRVLNGGDFTEPGHGAPPALRQLWRESSEIAFAWRAQYNLAPTDPRFLDATLDEMADDLLMHLYSSTRARVADPNDPVGREIVARSTEVVRFLSALKENRSVYDAQAARWMNRHKRVEPRTVVKVISGIPQQGNRR